MCFQPGSKPYMQHHLQVTVDGKMMASEGIFEGSKHENLMEQSQGCMVDVLRSQSIAVGILQQCGQQYRDWHCSATKQHFLIMVLGIYSKSKASACHAVFHCTVRCLS
jgi:hypothetical protein